MAKKSIAEEYKLDMAPGKLQLFVRKPKMENLNDLPGLKDAFGISTSMNLFHATTLANQIRS